MKIQNFPHFLQSCFKLPWSRCRAPAVHGAQNGALSNTTPQAPLAVPVPPDVRGLQARDCLREVLKTVGTEGAGV